MPLSNMQGSSTTWYPSIINNLSSYFLGRYDIGSSTSRHASYFEHTDKSKTQLIYLFSHIQIKISVLLPHQSPDTSNHIFNIPLYSSIPWVILQLSNLCLCNRPHPNFRLDPLPLNYLLYNWDNRWALWGLGRGWGGVRGLRIQVVNIECAVD